MSKKSPWGPIISTDFPDEDDPILKLKERIRAIRDAPLDLKGDKTIKEAEKEKEDLIRHLDSQMQEIIYARKRKKLLA
jgi:hypothetical protein